MAVSRGALALAVLLLAGCGNSAPGIPQAVDAGGGGGARPERATGQRAAATLVDPGSAPSAGDAALVSPGAPELEQRVLTQDEADALAEEAIAPEDLDVQLEKLERELRGDG